MTGENDDSDAGDWPPKRSGRRLIGEGPTPKPPHSSPETPASADEGKNEPPPSERVRLPGGIELQAAMRQAFDTDEDPGPVDVLRGVQGRLRERSGGKFYGDGWSTLRRPPFATFFITSLMMLAIIAIVYAILVPLVGDPVELPKEPAPINVIPP
jgi:hypothetical protein